MRYGVGVAGLAAAVMAGLTGCGTQAAAGPEGAERAAPARTAPAGTLPPSTDPVQGSESLSSAELQGRWWTWAASEPEATNPVADGDGRACARNQPQDVWFLAGTFGGRAERACEVPGGRSIAAPVVNTFGDPERCADFMSGAQGTVVLDGKVVEPEAYPGDSITVLGAQGNPVTGEEGRFAATGCGLWVQLPPLAPGKHSLKIRGRSGGFSTGVDYALTVVASADSSGSAA
ncbi:signal protein [Streptomyces sp. NPDC015492]|uniref:signal protein n=1 Tax=Streptomyces sp. NPDC015492 TaxID=3364958 RepID=UPI003701B0C6